MKLPSVPGEFGFHACLKHRNFWHVTDEVFFTKEEVLKWFEKIPPTDFKWPVEVYENGTIYIPAPEELE